MRITVLAGGVGGARFLKGVRALAGDHDIRAVVNTGDDAWVAGLYVTPDLDSIMYALAGVNDEERGWGRQGESERVSAELTAWGVGWPWFTLGDLDLGAHIARTSWLREGLPLTDAAQRLAGRWDIGVRLLPATDGERPTFVRLADGSTVHFQEWWVRLRGTPAEAFEFRGDAPASAAALEAIADADVVLLAPSNPVVSIGAILAVPGVAHAVRTTSAPVIGVSPIIGGAVVRGMADACLAAIGVETDAAAVARHYGARAQGGLIDGWLVGEEDAASVADVEALGIRARAVPLWMRDEELSRAIAGAAVQLAGA
ncbi:2-phospho-L-lactate transferase [Galbitalea sp. SE-J8]|uniref:2-phospho-L-lactate transferase n=1 Tax=Galbitalea sp. SE-J8 TaxID=3054952 RepID=UPI00259C9D64|nr:2-phospho-L-lactate transferase [Galbitalea sp. SE-J8]MDM4763908.1 2-phospho-L-lactate transferase [Galbitalea sp. SE-J8]